MLVVFSCVIAIIPILVFVNEEDLNPFVYLNACSMLIHAALQVFAAVKAWQSVPQMKYNINILKELVLTIIAWIGFTGSYHYWMIYGHNYSGACRIKEENWIPGIGSLVVRNVSLAFIIIYTCLIEKPAELMHRLSIYADETNRDCLVKVETAIVTEQALAKFVEYLKREGILSKIKEINAFTLIREFEEFAAFDSGNPPESVHEKAAEIWDKFCNEETDVHLGQIPPDIGYTISEKLKDDDDGVDKHLFDQVYGMIINSLQRCFMEFRNSQEFRELSLELDKKSLISGKLKKADLV